MSHFNELTNCFLSLAHHQCFCLSSPFSSFLCQSVLDIMFNLQCELMHGGHLSVKITLSQRKSYSRLPLHHCTVIRVFQLMTSDAEKEALRDFSPDVLTQSVTLAEFLISFCRGD